MINTNECWFININPSNSIIELKTLTVCLLFSRAENYGGEFIREKHLLSSKVCLIFPMFRHRQNV